MRFLRTILLVFLSVAVNVSILAQETNKPDWKALHYLSQEEMESGLSNRLTNFTATAAPTGTIRFPGEFEPMQAVMVRYPLGIPVDLVKTMAEECKVITLVSSYYLSSARNAYNNAGVNMDNCEFVTITTDSYWVRDYCPWYIFNNNEPAIVDFRYNRPRENDDIAPVTLAEDYFNIPWYGMDVTHTGGNMMQDGRGFGISDILVIDESTSTESGYSGITEAQVYERMEAYLGIDNYLVTADPQGNYIAHVDCWGKLLAPDKILIARMPESDSQHEAYEEIADYFATTNCCWGYPYTVYRVDELSSSSSSQVAPYTNSLILNDRVFVPLGTNDTYNENALAVYREAMPGYTIIGVEEDSNHPWENTDALHCRTRGVMDFDMLFVDHRNVIQGEQPMQSSFQVTSTFIPYSGEALASAQIYYRIDGGEWQTATMTATREEDEYTGYITGYSYGSTVEYYVSATDAAGNTSTQPVMGAQDPHSFKIEESSSSLYWTADDSGYDNYMPITAIVQIDGVEQATNTLEVGVFCGDECRASAIGELFSFNNKYILSLLVYGQDDEEFSFRLYDHSTGAELTPDLVAPANVTFSQDGYGSPLDPYVLNFTTVTPEYDITVSANPTAGGTVSGAGTYTQGDQATVTASANEGYDFVNWTINGTEVSTSASYTFTVAEAAELVANFSLKTYTITVNANPAEGGTVTGAGTYNHGDEVTLTATANENYRFIGWMEEGEVISSETTYTFTASADKTYTAKFSSSLYWTADPGEIEDNMNMSAIIQIDGEEQFTNTLEVGVFVGEECRASAIGVLAPFNNRYILTLLIYGTEDESFSFRLYDHATEAELTLTLAAPADVTFNTDGYGSPINPYVLNFTSETATVRQDFSLNAGWNWWSTYLEMEDGEGLSLLEDALGSNGIQIKSKNGFNSYTDFGWYGSLDALFNENMYLVKVAEAGDYSITGTVADPAEHTITLNSGWNWIGYVESTAIDINTALANLSASNNDMIKSHNSFTTYIEGYGWAGTLTSLTPSQGYLVSAANAASFVYPSAKGHEYDASDDLVAETYWKPAGNKFPHNMSVLAVVELDGVELRTEDAELAAFAADGECRGAVKLMYVEPLDRYLAFLTVYGEDGEQLHFRVRHGETNHGVEQTLTMMIDEVHGTATMPYMITAKGNTGLAENAILGLYPNPSAKGQQVRIDLAETSGAFTIEVIDILGRCIYTTDSNTLSAPEVPGAYTLRVTDEQGNTQFGKLIVK